VVQPFVQLFPFFLAQAMSSLMLPRERPLIEIFDINQQDVDALESLVPHPWTLDFIAHAWPLVDQYLF
jgi:hypothetical protein